MRLASIFSAQSFASVTDPSLRPTWLTTTPLPLSALVFCDFLRQMNWTRVYVYVDTTTDNVYYNLVSVGVLAALPKCGVTPRKYVGPSKVPTESSLRDMLADFHTRHRGKVTWLKV